MPVTLTYPSEWIPKLTTARYPMTGTGYQLTDEAGAAITLSTLTTITLTIYNLSVSPAVVVAGTWPRDIKNANGGAVSSTGLLVLTVPRDENAILVATNAYETRLWVIEWTYATGAKTQRLEVVRVIENTADVPVVIP